jgi:DNA-binding ferritin-like protein
MADKKTDTTSDKIVAEAKEAFDLCVEREEQNRTAGLDDLRFARLAEQWPEHEAKKRLEEKRPVLKVNKLPAYIRQVVNDVRQNSPSMIVHPADSGADPRTAEIINGLMRNIETCSDADIAYDTATEYAVCAGFGYFRVNLEFTSDDTFEKDIRLRRIANPFSVYGDPFDFGADSADWNIAFVTDRMSKKQYEAKYNGADPIDWAGGDYRGMGTPWLDGDEVQVAEYWKRVQAKRNIVLLSDNTVVDEKAYAANKAAYDAEQITVVATRAVRSHEVTQYVLNGAETLETVKWVGRYIPIVPVYGEDIVVDDRRHLRSLIRDAKDPQQMFNYWRTTATELVALAPKAPWIGPKGFADSDPRWDTANTQSHPYLEYDGNQAPQRQPFAGVPAGALQEALNSNDDMKAIMGMFDASLGAKSNETSGRAILARQREGDVSNFHFADNLSRAIRHAGRIILDLIPQVYTSERVIRVMGLDGKPQNVPINQPVVLQEGQPPQPAPAAPAPGQDPQIPDGAILHVFDLTAGKYDLTVETGPSFTTQREEAATQIMELLRAFPQAAPYIGDILAKNLDWPGADEIAKRLEIVVQHLTGGGQPGQQPGAPGAPASVLPPDAMAMLQHLQQMVAALEQENAQLKQTQSVAQQEADSKTYDAQTRRLKVIADAQKPSHAPQQATALRQ